MSQQAEDSPVKTATGNDRPFEKRYAFEPEPGQVGMGEAELRAIGEIGEAVTGGTFEAVSGLVVKLRSRRESLGMSLSDVSERSGLSRQVISKLEDGHDMNPTVDTLFRYSMAMGLLVTLGVDELGADDQDGGA